MRIGIIMDPIEHINRQKDTSFALLLESQRRGHMLYYARPQDVFLRETTCCGVMRRLAVADQAVGWYDLGPPETMPLASLDLLLMRQDPPVDETYWALTHLLDYAASAGLCIINTPSAVRDANEKILIAQFPAYMPNTRVTASVDQIKAFMGEVGRVVLKPLNAMGGHSIFIADPADPNVNVILETMTAHGQRMVMAQTFLPEIKAGDKRIILIDGKPLPYVLVRIPHPSDFRGNLASGARSEVRPLTEAEQQLCQEVGPVLAAKGLFFVGLDVIGDHITEINVTSPTGIREIEAATGMNMAALFFDAYAHRSA